MYNVNHSAIYLICTFALEGHELFNLKDKFEHVSFQFPHCRMPETSFGVEYMFCKQYFGYVCYILVINYLSQGNYEISLITQFTRCLINGLLV